MLKIAYIGNRGFHSDNVNGATRGDSRFTCCAVAGGTPDEDMSAFYKYITIDHPDARMYSDYVEMLEKEKPDVAVVSPEFYLTASVCMECAKRKINVFAEKPVATELDELKQLQDVIKESGIHFAAMHFLRFSGGFYHAVKAVKNGDIGDVRMINAQKSYKLGQRADFFKSRETYGGTIPWVGIHGIDWIYTLADKPCKKVTAVHSSTGNCDHGDLEATCLCQFVFEDDVMASLNVDYIRPQSAPTHSDDRLRVVGTEGILNVQDGKLTVINCDGVKTYEEPSEIDLALDFLESILENRPCVLSSDEIFEITELALLARESADMGETIIIERG